MSIKVQLKLGNFLKMSLTTCREYSALWMFAILACLFLNIQLSANINGAKHALHSYYNYYYIVIAWSSVVLIKWAAKVQYNSCDTNQTMG